MREIVEVFQVDGLVSDLLVVLVLTGLFLGNVVVHEYGHSVVFNDFGCKDVEMGFSLGLDKGLGFCVADCSGLSELEFAVMQGVHSLWEVVHVLAVFLVLCSVVVYNLFMVGGYR